MASMNTQYGHSEQLNTEFETTISRRAKSIASAVEILCTTGISPEVLLTREEGFIPLESSPIARESDLRLIGHRILLGDITEPENQLEILCIEHEGHTFIQATQYSLASNNGLEVQGRINQRLEAYNEATRAYHTDLAGIGVMIQYDKVPTGKHRDTIRLTDHPKCRIHPNAPAFDTHIVMGRSRQRDFEYSVFPTREDLEYRRPLNHSYKYRGNYLFRIGEIETVLKSLIGS